MRKYKCKGLLLILNAEQVRRNDNLKTRFKGGVVPKTAIP